MTEQGEPKLHDKYTFIHITKSGGSAVENYFEKYYSHHILKENIKDAIEKIPKEYYRNILEGAYNRKEKHINKHNKTRKNAKKIYL